MAGETEVLGGNLPHATLSTINPIRPDPGSNLGCHSGKLVTKKMLGNIEVCDPAHHTICFSSSYDYF
jgi:hypothetical protein